MVILSKIYTRTGDGGTTRLADNSVARKTDLRVEAYGDVDECNSHLGVVLADPSLPGELADVLRVVQNELFDVGADLSTPLRDDPPWPPLRIADDSVERLEHWCDLFGDALPTLRSFVLPGGTPVSAHLHVARTVCRRAERAAWAAREAYGVDSASAGSPEGSGGVNPVAITYLNRLSDLLFIMARAANTGAEPLWVPGTDRMPSRPAGPEDAGG
ncbi:MAG TPA: cob(I)yrinic acid a,c-diamide adenosyltransferase [Propionibacteriaceae bacterium]|nr:cob(I)yrinic acid a,c-diamide adenosyltransferase [Propionibacteriaceae bacterium]